MTPTQIEYINLIIICTTITQLHCLQAVEYTQQLVIVNYYLTLISELNLNAQAALP